MAEKVLVTGGAGMIGSNIVKKLLERGNDVVTLDDMSAYPFDYLQEFGVGKMDAEVVEGSILDKDAVHKAMEGADKVIHAAAYADVGASVRNYDIDFQVNVVGTENILEESLKRNIGKLVFVSSASVYGENGKRVFSEEDARFPLSTYGNSKLWGENQALLFHELHGLPTAAVRLFSVYGSPQVPKEGSHSWCVAIFSMLIMRGKPITVFGNGTQIRDFTHVSDIAEGTIRALEREETDGKVLNIGTGRPTQIKTIAEKLFEELGETDIEYAPHPPGDPFGAYADVTRMKEVLAWEPEIPLDDGIAEYCNWVKTNRHLIPDWV